MTGPVTTEAMVDQIARILDPDAHHLGLPDYYGPEPILAGASARVRVARKNAGAIIAGPLAPLLAAHQQVTAERDEARAKQRDMHRRAQKAESFRERHRGGFNYLMNGKRKERFARRAAEASLATANAELARLRAEGEAKDRARGSDARAVIELCDSVLGNAYIGKGREDALAGRVKAAFMNAALARAATVREGA